MKLTTIKNVITDKISGEWGDETLDGQGVIVIRTANFLNTGQVNFSNLVRREIDQKKVEKKRLISGDIIIEKSGGSPTQPVGRVVIFRNPDNDTYLCNNFTSILRPNRNKVHPEYLFYVLYDNHKKGKTLRYQNKTTGIINLKLDSYLDLEIPLPPLEDQKRIAHLLGKMEELIARRKHHLQQLDDLLKSVFLEMFGDPVRNEREWETKTLPQLVLPGKNSLKRGPFGGALKKEIFVDSGYLVYEQNHALNGDYSFGRYFISEEKYNELIDFKVLPNDILISCSGIYLGKLSIVPEWAKPGIINQALLKISLNPERIKHIFFVYVFGSPQFKNKYFPSNRGGAIPNLPPMVEMKKIPFVSPPIKLQEKFVTIVNKVENLKSRYQQSLTDLESLYGALSQKAFKGELDLSRVFMILSDEKESAKDIELDIPRTTSASTTLAIELPTPEAVNDLTNANGRMNVIEFWMESYIENSNKYLNQ